MKKIKNMVIIKAIKWFDKVNGNTYHSVKVFDGKDLIGQENLEYGYGDHYRQTAFKIMIKEGYFKGTRRTNGTYEELIQFQDLLKEGLVFCDNVNTQRELKNF